MEHNVGKQPRAIKEDSVVIQGEKDAQFCILNLNKPFSASIEVSRRGRLPFSSREILILKQAFQY